MKISKTPLFIAALALAGCSDWTPVKNANDVQGVTVKVRAEGKDEVVVDEVVPCDEKGFVFAKQASDCSEGSTATFDTRRDKVLVHSKDSTDSVGYIVVGVLTAIFVPFAIVGSAMLSGGKY
jgi:hypothetical protein